MISVGIVGASGYTGEELVKILQNHPEVEIHVLTSRSHNGKNIMDVFNLELPLQGTFKLPDINNLKDCDVVFFATPNGVAMEMAKELVENDVRIIDISADFRLQDPKSWEKWYGTAHLAPALLDQSVYGLPEIPGYKERIQNSQIVANPGCYPTAALLSLLPIYQSLSSQKIIIDAKSGISGAGRNLDSKKLFPEGEDNFQAYAVQNHRHYPEILQIINDSSSDLDVLFVPHLSSMIRGIFSTTYLNYNDEDPEKIINIFNNFYNDSTFVEVSESGYFPKVSDVVQTNKCKISIHIPEHENGDINVVIFSVIDNLVKGASGQAVQNMNIMFSLDEKLGLI